MGIPEHNAEAQFAALADVLSNEGVDVEAVKTKLKAQEIETPCLVKYEETCQRFDQPTFYGSGKVDFECRNYM